MQNIALLGESDLLAGQIDCPRSPPNIIASFTSVIPNPKEWVVQGVCAYVPQVWYHLYKINLVADWQI